MLPRSSKAGTASSQLQGASHVSVIIKTTNPHASGELVGDIRFGHARDNIHTPIGRNHWRFNTEGHKFQVLAFTNAEDKAAAYVTARPAQTNVNTCAAITQVKAWL